MPLRFRLLIAAAVGREESPCTPNGSVFDPSMARGGATSLIHCEDGQ
jgi:hypothetical protein